MQAQHVNMSIESFDDDESAEAAVRELMSVGFTKSQIGVISPGNFGELFWNAIGAGAARALSGLGISADHAERFYSDLQAGCTIIGVTSGTRTDIAQSVLNRFKPVLAYSM